MEEVRIAQYKPQAEGNENSITAIREFFEKDGRPLMKGEFIEFWKACSEAERIEFKKADLSA